MSCPRIFAELFTGSAAVTLQLLGGSRVTPPVAYMGSKRGLAGVILAAVGLEPGQGAESVLLCDGGPWGWVWQALAVPETCRAVADVLRSWSDEDPTALWRRLAAEPPPAEVVDRAATVLWLQGRAAQNAPIWWNGESWRIAWAPGHGATDGALKEKGTSNGKAAGLRSPLSVARDADRVADAVARFLAMQAHAPSGIPVWPGATGWEQDGRNFRADGRVWGAEVRKACRGNKPAPLADVAERAERALTSPLVVVNADIDHALALLPDDLTDCVVYLDPPYVGATRYACLCPREKVVAIARDLDRRGAIVPISEAVPVEELGWHTMEITHAKRSTSRKVKREWITMNRKPVAVPAMQLALGAA